MTDSQALRHKLQVGSNTALWVWPEGSTLPHALTPSDDLLHVGLADADVAMLITHDRAAVDTVMNEHRGLLATLRAVWIVYAKANKTDVNRDTLWVQLAGHGWRAISQVSFSDAMSALRIRPLRQGETPRAA